MKIPPTALFALVLRSAVGGGAAAAFGPAAGGRVSFSPRSLSSPVATTNSGSPLAPVPSRFGRVSDRSKTTKLHLAAEDDGDSADAYDEDDDPLGEGIDSVQWLPSALATKSSMEDSGGVRNGAEILPLFPLGGIVYTPNSEHVLNIFEPRYRQMYNDILMNGSKRFVVSMSHPTEEGSFAETGVLFQLEDLKEVSEQTGDKIKYICNHRVTGRVKIHRILNPESWSTRDTYLKVEGTITDDSGGSAGDGEGAKKDEEGNVALDAYATMTEALGKLGLPASDEERALQSAFSKMVDLQHDLQEDVRFTRASVDTLGVSDGAGDGSLWNTIKLWQSYAEQRLVARQNDMQREFQEKLLEFLTKEKGVSEEDVPSAIGFQDLSPELQAEVQELQRRMAVELRPLVLESTLTMQKILEAEDHGARVNLLRHFMDAERKRLEAKKTLQGMFRGSPGSLTAEPAVPEGDGGAASKKRGVIEKAMDKSKEESKEGEEEGKEEKGSAPPPQPKSIFMDEPDAFQ